MPLAVLGAAWLFYVWRPAWKPGTTGAATPGSRRRIGPVSLAIWASTLVLLLAGLPMVWKTMSTYSYQYEENVFLRALVTGDDQEGNTGIGGYPIGIADEKQMATYITDEIPDDAVILTDDAQSLGVMVLTGHPDRFFDRIDKGDGPWNVALNNPWGKVDYFLVSTNERCRRPCVDLIREQWPGVLQGQVPGMEVVFSTDRTALISVAPEPPGPNAVAPADRKDAKGSGAADAAAGAAERGGG